MIFSLRVASARVLRSQPARRAVADSISSVIRT
jgi:hypothetical protein